MRDAMYLKVTLTLLVILEAAAAAALWRAAEPEPGATFYTDAEVAAGLNRRVGSVRMKGVPLGEAVDQLARQAGARVTFEENGVVTATTLASPVDVELNDVPLSAALAVVLPAGVAARADGAGTVRVDRPEWAPTEFVLRAYDAGSVLRRLARGRDPDEFAWWLEELVHDWVDHAPDTQWRPIRVAGDLVIVLHDRAVHRGVEQTLAELREAIEEFDAR